MAEVIRATDGPLASVRGQRPESVAYEGAAERLSEVWIAVRSNLRGVLETVTLAGTPDNRDGSWLRVRRLGYYVADVRDAAGMACYIDLRELEEVEYDSGTDLAGQSDPDTGRHLGGRPA